MHLKCTTPNFSLTGNIVTRLQQIYFQQNEEKEKKLKQWEIWVIRINKLQGECQEKVKDLKSKGDPHDKKDLEEQIVLAKVSLFLSVSENLYVLSVYQRNDSPGMKGEHEKSLLKEFIERPSSFRKMYFETCMRLFQ